MCVCHEVRTHRAGEADLQAAPGGQIISEERSLLLGIIEMLPHLCALKCNTKKELQINHNTLNIKINEIIARRISVARFDFRLT